MVCQVCGRVAFGKPLSEQGLIQADIARSRIDIESNRLLVLKAAHNLDTHGSKVAMLSLSLSLSLYLYFPG